MKQLIFFALLLSACTNESDTRRTLESEGYTDVQVDGYSWFVCSDDDVFATKFTAKNANGKIVYGTVCCGFLTKGCTVRF